MNTAIKWTFETVALAAIGMGAPEIIHADPANALGSLPCETADLIKSCLQIIVGGFTTVLLYRQGRQINRQKKERSE
jgi:hypothetical protein